MPFTFADAVAALRAGGDHHELARRLTAEMTDDEKLDQLDGDGPFWAGLTYMTAGGYHRSPFFAAAVPRLGVDGWAFSDGPRGVVVDRATCFPVSMARGATWDLDLEERIGEAIGRELRAVGASLYGGVCVNVLRHPAWGRSQETYGEDPHHVGEMGAALTRGVQRHAMACVKHFAANSMENARFRIDVTVDEAALHEVYLPHFRRIVDEGVACVMTAYNRVNGEWAGESVALVDEVLRGEWGFDGFVISDWIFGLRDAAASVRAGMDVEMPYRMIRARDLRAAMERGEVGWADVDACVERVLATLLRFERVLSAPVGSRRDVLACPEHRALAREAAARSVVLLRNEPVGVADGGDDGLGAPVLPLDVAAIRSIAVVGHLADEVNLGDGGSSDVWAPDAATILDGVRAAVDGAAPDGAAVTHDDGADPAAAAAVAAASDVAVVVVGYTFRDEGEFIGETDMAALGALFPGPDDPDDARRFEEWAAATAGIEAPPHVTERSDVGFATGGDRVSLRLHDHEVELIRAVAAANPRTVVVVVAGSAVIMSEWDSSVPAIVQSWYGGMAAGPGLVDVLTGAVEPTARLPFSVPVDESHLPFFDRDADAIAYDRWHGWWKLERDGHEAAYPFGFGLGYTTYELGEWSVAAGVDADGGRFVVRAQVRNTGPRDGSDVVQVYARRVDGDRPPRLVGFARVEVAAGSGATVEVAVPLDRLAERDIDAHRTVVRPGTYEVWVARDAATRGEPALVELAGVELG